MRTYKYEVNFNHAESHEWFYTKVYWIIDDKKIMIASKACCRNYKGAAKWANDKIKEHDEATRMLRGVLKP